MSYVQLIPSEAAEPVVIEVRLEVWFHLTEGLHIKSSAAQVLSAVFFPTFITV